MLNYKLYAQGGFTPDVITPGQVLRNYAKRRGGMGEQALSPPSSYQHLEFHINEKGILQSFLNMNGKFFKKTLLYAGEEI